MDKRFALFCVLVAGIFLANLLVVNWLFPPQPAPQQAVNPPAPEEAADGQAEPGQPAAGQPDGGAAAEEAGRPADPPALENPPEESLRWLTLGSLDADSPFRMLVTLTNRGAAVERIELADPKFPDGEKLHGYLGRFPCEEAPGGKGLVVKAVGPGTPAEAAGIEPADVVTMVNGLPVAAEAEIEQALVRTRPGETVEISLLRNGQPLVVQAKLIRTPMQLVRPELGLTGPDPLSFVMTLRSIDDRTLPGAAALDDELVGLAMRSEAWEVVRSTEDTAEFLYRIPEVGLEVRKRFVLASTINNPDAAAHPAEHPIYHLNLEVEVRNVGEGQRSVSYQLDGPTGLPDEGWWYSNKLHREWFSAAGIRDVAVGRYNGGSITHDLVPAAYLAKDRDDRAPPWQDKEKPVVYIGGDSQYFAVVMIPRKADPSESWFETTEAIPVTVPQEDSSEHRRLNTSCRVVSRAEVLAPGDRLLHTYTVFAGPKEPALLAQYDNLSDLAYYGWPIFGWVARVMLALLHFFYSLVGNYGLAIVMLTVLVRALMFPLSYKQSVNAQKMQELQPEMKRISEKFKSDAMARHKAVQELYKKHNFNMFSGCLPIFVQLPIFMGLYRSLSVDPHLRAAPLIPGLEWCSNLSAPDQLFEWTFLPGFVLGWLGPYFNLLPCATIALFIWQQKMFMPPPADEQQAAQQKMMKYMMIVMCVMFFKVPSGLCLYFIASSLWSIAERLLLPKRKPAADSNVTVIRSPQKTPSSNGTGLLGRILEKANKR
jgi:YidC/Oxa1 family membrane protein insertase